MRRNVIENPTHNRQAWWSLNRWCESYAKQTMTAAHQGGGLVENTTASEDHFIAAIDFPYIDVDDPTEFIPHVHDLYAFHSERAQ